ncbi:MAG TPA: alpha/beta family hydrolase [Bryobacteraceae bacterium]
MKSPGKRFERPLIRGFLHEPEGAPRGAIVLFHGAGGNCEGKLLVAAAAAFCKAGFLAFRGDLPFRQEGKSPPRNSEKDRDGIRGAAEELRALAPGARLYLSGQSYGGRQCTMLAAEDSSVADGLMLLSYPLHPPGNPQKPRTEHFPSLRTTALFVHGMRDPFGTIEELQAALPLIPARTTLIPVKSAGHSLPESIAPSLPEWLSDAMKF